MNMIKVLLVLTDDRKHSYWCELPEVAIKENACIVMPHRFDSDVISGYLLIKEISVHPIRQHVCVVVEAHPATDNLTRNFYQDLEVWLTSLAQHEYK